MGGTTLGRGGRGGGGAGTTRNHPSRSSSTRGTCAGRLSAQRRWAALVRWRGLRSGVGCAQRRTVGPSRHLEHVVELAPADGAVPPAPRGVADGAGARVVEEVRAGAAPTEREDALRTMAARRQRRLRRGEDAAGGGAAGGTAGCRCISSKHTTHSAACRRARGGQRAARRLPRP